MERIAELLPKEVAQMAESLSEIQPLPVNSSTNAAELSAVVYALEEQDVRSVWSAALQELAQQLDAELVNAWLRPLAVTAIHVSPSTLTTSSSLEISTEGAQGNIALTEVYFAAPNKFASDYVQEHFSSLLCAAFQQILGSEQVLLEFRVNKTTGFSQSLSKETTSDKGLSMYRQSPRSPKLALGENSNPVPSSANGSPRVNAERSSSLSTPAHQPPVRESRPHSNSNLNQNYNFSNFVVGACNQFAHAVSLRVSETPGVNYNPLFIYGGVGLGKTHLANAIGNASCRRQKNVLLVSSEVFVSELIAALRSNRMQQFKNKFRSLDVLIIDDIQFIIGKERTQEEFFHTFNELHQHNKQIILTSDKMPAELVGLEERLRTRFSSGLSVDLQSPDFETRVAILIRKSESLGSIIPEDVARVLAESIDTNVRELEGALNRLLAMSSLHGEAMSVDLAREVLSSVSPNKSREISIELIQKIVAERYSVSLHDLLGKRRTHNIAFARQIGMFLTRRLTGCSFPEIGAFYGGRDHSTVIHACRVVEERAESDSKFKEELSRLEKDLTV